MQVKDKQLKPTVTGHWGLFIQPAGPGGCDGTRPKQPRFTWKTCRHAGLNKRGHLQMLPLQFIVLLVPRLQILPLYHLSSATISSTTTTTSQGFIQI